uniref:Short-chain dehydrogenase/reductase 3 n=1 Tax=Parastrongyloides trichosuri TaxID=131310 RepID=A0A0N4Z8P4_PARTI
MLEGLLQLFNFFYYLILGCITALLPRGFLPRKDVKGKLVLITGGGNGLGKYLAIAFGKLGSKLVLWDIDKKSLDQTVEELKKSGVECWGYVVDVTNKNSIYETADKVKETIGAIDILINNAGIANAKPFLRTPDDALERIMNINIMAHFYTCKAFVPAMVEKKSGHIVTMASMAGKTPSLGIVDYSTSKFAAVGFGSALGEELKVISDGTVKVTTICPYFIKTNLTANIDLPSSTLLPVLEIEEAVEIMMEGILTEQTQLILPKFGYTYSVLYNLLPTKAFYSLTETKLIKDKLLEELCKVDKKID